MSQRQIAAMTDQSQSETSEILGGMEGRRAARVAVEPAPTGPEPTARVVAYDVLAPGAHR
jgi:hypothetical protein